MFLSRDVQVDSAMLFILHQAFVILFSVLSFNVMSITFVSCLLPLVICNVVFL